jgi:hypothetical protein
MSEGAADPCGHLRKSVAKASWWWLDFAGLKPCAPSEKTTAAPFERALNGFALVNFCSGGSLITSPLRCGLGRWPG